VLGNDTDVDGDTLSARLIRAPSNGGINFFLTDGSFRYSPNPGFTGSDSFTYRARDGALNSNLATVTITVTAVNDAP
jgi:hypothetical protein